MSECLSTLATILFLSAATAQDAPKGDLARLQGDWSTKIGIDKDIDLRITIKDRTVTGKVTTADGREFELKGELKLDEGSKPHRSIDWVNFTGPDGQEIDDNLGIYKFENDDIVTICNGGPGNPRPDDFKVGDRGDPQVLSLRREKPEAEQKEEIKGDLARFQGAWGAKLGPNEDVELTMTITGSDVNLRLARDGEDRAFKGKIELDESAKPHKAITFKGFTRADGTEAPENLGIYVFEGDDTVKVCTGGPGNARPTEIKAGEGGPPTLITLTRKPN